MAPNVSSLWNDQRRTTYIAPTTTTVFRCSLCRSGTLTALVSSFKVLIRQAFVNPLTSRFRLRGSDWVVLLHSLWPMKFTMSTSPPLAMIFVFRRRAATSSLFPGAICWPLDFYSNNDCFILNSRHRIMKCPEPKFLHIGHVLALHVVQLIYID